MRTHRWPLGLVFWYYSFDFIVIHIVVFVLVLCFHSSSSPSSPASPLSLLASSLVILWRLSYLIYDMSFNKLVMPPSYNRRNPGLFMTGEIKILRISPVRCLQNTWENFCPSGLGGPLKSKNLLAAYKISERVTEAPGGPQRQLRGTWEVVGGRRFF